MRLLGGARRPAVGAGGEPVSCGGRGSESKWTEASPLRAGGVRARDAPPEPRSEGPLPARLRNERSADRLAVPRLSAALCCRTKQPWSLRAWGR